VGEVLHGSLLQLLLEHCDFLNIDISQGSVATRLRCGGTFKYELHVLWSVLGTPVSPAKMDKPIKIPFGGQTRMSPRNHVLDRRTHQCHLASPTCGSDAALNYFDHLLLITIITKQQA